MSLDHSVIAAFAAGDQQNPGEAVVSEHGLKGAFLLALCPSYMCNSIHTDCCSLFVLTALFCLILVSVFANRTIKQHGGYTTIPTIQYAIFTLRFVLFQNRKKSAFPVVAPSLPGRHLFVNCSLLDLEIGLILLASSLLVLVKLLNSFLKG